MQLWMSINLQVLLLSIANYFNSLALLVFYTGRLCALFFSKLAQIKLECRMAKLLMQKSEKMNI